MTTSEPRPPVYVLDDDSSVRTAVGRLLLADGWPTRTFATIADCLEAVREAPPACLVCDLNLPDGDGLAVQRALADVERPVPIVFLSGQADVPSSVTAMKGGAVDFLTKPCDDAALLAAVARGVARGAEDLRARTLHETLHERASRLTSREREVFALVAAGRLNKQVAAALGVAERTVKAHRARVMEKMGADSVADLVRMADLLGLRAASNAAVSVAA